MRFDEETKRPNEDRDLPFDRPVSRRDLLRYGGMLGFGAVGATMLASCTPVANEQPNEDGRANLKHPPAAKAKYLAVVIIDGCRSDYISPEYFSEGKLPNLTAMRNSGTHYTNAWTGIMESITPACHASIGTGRFAKNNGGVLGFYWENPTTKQYIQCANLTDSTHEDKPTGLHNAVNADSIAQILKQANTPTMAALLKSADPTAKVYTGAGVKFYAADAVGGPDADYISYYWNDGAHTYRPLSVPGHELPPGILDDPALRTETYQTMNAQHPGQQDGLVVDLAVKVIKQERPRMVILNLGEMDYPFGHQDGGSLDPKAVHAIIGNADAAMGRLMDAYKELGIFEETVFAFLGDHGMVPLAQQVDIGINIFQGGLESDSAVQQAAATAGTSIVGSDFHTGGFVWLADPTKAMKMSSLLDEAKLPGVAAVYFRGLSAGRMQFLPSPHTAATVTPQTAKAYAYLLETLNGSNAPHIILLYPERTGTLGAGGLNGGKPNQWFGDHGGASWRSHSIPLIITGPGVLPGHTSRFPARLVDLAPTFLRLMGVPYPMLDGVVLADLLVEPHKSEIASQRVMGAQLIPVASALKRQSNADVHRQLQNPGLLANPPQGAPTSGPATGIVY